MHREWDALSGPGGLTGGGRRGGSASGAPAASAHVGAAGSPARGPGPCPLTRPRCLAQVLEESKALVRCSMKPELEQANERECEVLRKIWGSAQGMDSMLKYLQRKIDEF